MKVERLLPNTCHNRMDAVITYVNGLDPLWQEDYRTHVDGAVTAKRFRDWGTLPYLLRGIERHMPFVENVFLVVARESQVPSWVDRSRVNIVLHSEIIPERFLPVFNSTAIELFLWRIPGLGEEFVYFNDDFFPMADCAPEDFFQDGKAVIHFSRHFLCLSQYMRHTRNSDRMAAEAAGQHCGVVFHRPQHICTPLLRSGCEEAYARVEAGILSSVTKVREDCNVNYYLFCDYLRFTGRTVDRKLSRKHFSLAVTSADKLCGFIAGPDRKVMCVNDVKVPEEKYEELRSRWLAAFEEAFPSKSCFEL